MTFVMDRGGDAYESLARTVELTRRDFIVRSHVNRKAMDRSTGQCGSLKQLLEAAAVVDVQTKKFRKLFHKSKSSGKVRRRKARQTRLNLKYLPVELLLPDRYDPQAPRLDQPLYLVEVSEDLALVPRGEKPVCWRILTTWPLQTIAEAWKVVEIYQKRWEIEQLFRLLKKQGFDVESSQLHHPDRIKKLVAMSLVAAVTAQKLVAARDGKSDVQTCEVFTAQEVSVLHKMNQRYAGKTAKTSNPHLEENLAWAAWIIARAGHWSGYEAQSKPGPSTMLEGLKVFQILCAFLPQDKT